LADNNTGIVSGILSELYHRPDALSRSFFRIFSALAVLATDPRVHNPAMVEPMLDKVLEANAVFKAA
jgi:hypothetical protein